MTPEHAEAYARHIEANPEKPLSKRWKFDTHRTLDGWNGGRTKPSGPKAGPSDTQESFQ